MCDKIDTIDELVRRIDQGHYDESSGFHHRRCSQTRATKFGYERIESAIIAISALFLHQEGKVARQGLRRYQEFLNELFPGADSAWPASTNSCHVLTFNYDRMFEAAFRERFNFDTQRLGFYGGRGLNSGLDIHYNRQVKFSENQFSFLKLHGSVGMWAVEELNDVCHHYGLPRVNEPQEISDDMFYQKKSSDNKSRKRTAFPLLFLPAQAAVRFGAR